MRQTEMDEMTISEEDERHWSEKVSSGIAIGAKWISWGLSKGAEVTGHLVEQVCDDRNIESKSN